MPSDLLRQRFRAQLSELEQAEESRLVNLCVEWRLPNGAALLRAGGIWDRIDRTYLRKEPERVKVIRLQPSQVLTAQACAWWFQERAEGRERDFFNLFAVGDRGSGKTFIAVTAMITAAIQFPTMGGKPTLVWLVSQSYRERDEIEREIAENFPFESIWYSHRKAPEYRYSLVNGVTIRNLSADDPESLKQGRVDFLMLNEAAKMSRDAYLNGVGRLKDQDGFCLATTNPPRTNRGRWVYNLWKKTEEAKELGKSYPVRFLQVSSEGNETIHRGSADQIAVVVRDVDPRYAQADVDGIMLPIDKPAYWEWIRSRNARPLPDLGDITRQYTKLRTGKAYNYLAGADFQGRPHMVATFAKVYGSIDEPLLYFCDEVICPQATERDLADEVREAGYTSDDVLWIGDSSGQWQNGRHLRNEHDSFRAIRDAGFVIQPPVKPKTPDHRPGNPPIEQRVGLINAQLKTGRIHVDPELAPRLVEGLAECILKESRTGRVVPVGIHAHITDSAGYLVWWVYSKGRRKLPPGPLAIVGERTSPSLFG